MTKAELSAELGRLFEAWVGDADSDVVAAELVEGRWAVRMAQRTRDFTTVWVTPDERTVRFEAYVLPGPLHHVAEVFRQLLFRNQDAWLVHFAIDRDSEVYLRGKVAADGATEDTLQLVFGEIYQLIELSFRPLLEAGYRR